MRYVQLNIGRGVTDSGPLTEYEWEQFQAEAKDLLLMLFQDLACKPVTGVTVEFHTGNGVWVDHSEESVHISILIPVFVKSDQDAAIMARFTRQVKQLAKDNHQEAIALIVGSKLVKSA